MKWPPYWLKIKIEGEHHSVPLWLPLFIIGPLVLLLLLAVFLIILPFALLAFIFTWELGWWRPVFMFFPAFFRLICQLPGLEVDVGKADGRIHIVFL
jgi:hypothetical protein